jgi:hypothetical protein
LINIESSLTICFLVILLNIAYADDPISHTFEFRYFSTNTAANGETDFKGATAIFNTEDRVKFLNKYADYASEFFGNPNLDIKAVSEEQLLNTLKKFKIQPLPSVRKRLLLKNWKWTACKANTPGEADQKRIPNINGTSVDEGHLIINSNQIVKFAFPAQSWRFSFVWRIQVPFANQKVSFKLSDADKSDGVTVGFDSRGKIYYQSQQAVKQIFNYAPDQWYEFKIETDLSSNRYNLYIDDHKVADFVQLQDSLKQINLLSIQAIPGVKLDDIWGVGYTKNDHEKRPFGAQTFLDHSFNQKPSLIDWTEKTYDEVL